MSEPLTADQPYKIYQYLQPGHDDTVDPYEAPWEIDYITGITTRLHPVRSFTLGEMTEVIYYAGFDGTNYSEPVVRETYTYVRDPASVFAISRTQTIQWYDTSGNLADHVKIRGPKYYNSLSEKINEVGKKRQNQANRAAEVAIGAMMQVHSYDFATAAYHGQTYWKSLASLISGYRDGNTQPLRDQITADSNAGDPSWLIPAIRDLILAELA